MITLKKLGWQTIGLEDFQSFIKGEKELPDKSFLLTFDDGRKDSYYPVDPILKSLNYRAVGFIITGRSLNNQFKDHPYPLILWELRDMIKTGRWEIQSHGRDDHELYKIDSSGQLGHFMTNKLWKFNENRVETEPEFKQRIKIDLEQSKKELEENLGTRIFAYAFPFGDFGQDSINLRDSIKIVPEISHSVYELTFHQYWEGVGDTFNYPTMDKNQIMKRIVVMPHWSTADLIKALDNGKSKSIPYFDNLTKNNGWIKTWGTMQLEKNGLIITSSKNTTGGTVFLDGSYSWRNYQTKTKVTLVKGYSFSILSRYRDDRNYLACVFSPDFVRVDQIIDGKREILAKQKRNGIPHGIETGMIVDNGSASCLFGDTSVVQANIISFGPQNGGIGFQSWDPNFDNSKVLVKTVSVTVLAPGSNTSF